MRSHVGAPLRRQPCEEKRGEEGIAFLEPDFKSSSDCKVKRQIQVHTIVHWTLVLLHILFVEPLQFSTKTQILRQINTQCQYLDNPPFPQLLYWFYFAQIVALDHSQGVSSDLESGNGPHFKSEPFTEFGSFCLQFAINKNSNTT